MVNIEFEINLFRYWNKLSSIFEVSPTTISYKYINYKTNIYLINTIFKTNLPSLCITLATLLYSFRRCLAFRKVSKFTKSCKNTTFCKKCTFVISLSSINAVVRMQISNLTNQCSLFTTVHYIFWDQWGWPPMNGEPCAHDIRWTLDFASAFLSPGVNSWAELEPSHGASRRRLGD